MTLKFRRIGNFLGGFAKFTYVEDGKEIQYLCIIPTPFTISTDKVYTNLFLSDNKFEQPENLISDRVPKIVVLTYCSVESL